MIAVYFYGIMPPGDRFFYLYRGVDPDFAEWQKRFLQTGADSPGEDPMLSASQIRSPARSIEHHCVLHSDLLRNFP
jgi:hypothetical protein